MPNLLSSGMTGAQHKADVTTVTTAATLMTVPKHFVLIFFLHSTSSYQGHDWTQTRRGHMTES
jgi:hypothetical protein